MIPTPAHIARLLHARLSSTLSPRENAELEEWLAMSDANARFAEELENDALISKLVVRAHADECDAIDEVLLQRAKAGLTFTERPSAKVRSIKTTWLRYVAILLLIAGTATYLNKSSRKDTKVAKIAPTPKPQDISPGGNKAILTVDDKQINLSAKKSGITVGNTITYIDGEQLSDAGKMLTLTTPRGGQYQLVLPDGSKAWLNAASSIKFPSRFDGMERKVEITGEAYLEVAKNSRQPFYVNTGRSTIQVLGTSFNVNAYPDEEAEKTTLVEGSIKIDNTLLKPGEAYSNGKVMSAKIEQVIAWKNGFFNLQDMSLPEVARQLERWYDIKVDYEGNLPDKNFEGKLSRGERLSTVLDWFTELGVHNRLEGKRLILSDH